jgi:hypothetical protein
MFVKCSAVAAPRLDAHGAAFHNVRSAIWPGAVRARHIAALVGRSTIACYRMCSIGGPQPDGLDASEVCRGSPRVVSMGVPQPDSHGSSATRSEERDYVRPPGWFEAQQFAGYVARRRALVVAIMSGARGAQSPLGSADLEQVVSPVVAVNVGQLQPCQGSAFWALLWPFASCAPLLHRRALWAERSLRREEFVMRNAHLRERYLAEQIRQTRAPAVGAASHITPAP